MAVKAHAGWARNEPAATMDAAKTISCLGVMIFEFLI
jgi:hypothetical protein